MFSFKRKYYSFIFFGFFLIAGAGFSFSIKNGLIYDIHSDFVFRSVTHFLTHFPGFSDSNSLYILYKMLFLDAFDLNYSFFAGILHFLYIKISGQKNLFDLFYTHLFFIFISFFVVYRISLKLFGFKTALLALLLTLCNSGLINYSRSNYLEFPMAVFINLSLLMVIESGTLQKKTLCFLSGFFLALATLIKFNACLYMVFPFIFIFYHFFQSIKVNPGKYGFHPIIFLMPLFLLNLPWFINNLTGILFRIGLNDLIIWGAVFERRSLQENNLAVLTWFFLSGIHICGQFIVYILPFLFFSINKHFSGGFGIFKRNSFEIGLLLIFLTGNFLTFTILFPFYPNDLLSDHWLPNFLVMNILIAFLISRIKPLIFQRLVLLLLMAVLFYNIAVPLGLVYKNRLGEAYGTFGKINNFFIRYVYLREFWTNLRGIYLPHNSNVPRNLEEQIYIKEYADYDYGRILRSVVSDYNQTNGKVFPIKTGILTRFNLDMNRNFHFNYISALSGQNMQVKTRWTMAELETLHSNLKEFDYFIFKNDFVAETDNFFQKTDIKLIDLNKKKSPEDKEKSGINLEGCKASVKSCLHKKLMFRFSLLTETLNKDFILFKEEPYLNGSRLLIYRAKIKTGD